MRRRLAVLCIASLLTLPVVASATILAATPAFAQVRAVAPAETGKYYVVGPPVNGQREYLFQIARTTLGDGNRYPEIFELNKDRVQPDGRTMTDPTSVEPGWVLALPKDASGPGVKSGPLPVISPSAPASPATPTADATTPAAEQTPVPEETDEAAGDGPPSGGLDLLTSPNALRIALVVLAVLLVVWAQMALAARRRPARAKAPAAKTRPVPGAASGGPPDRGPARGPGGEPARERPAERQRPGGVRATPERPVAPQAGPGRNPGVGTRPGSTPPGNSAPAGGAPGGGTPGRTVPGGSTPERTVPGNATPGRTAPQGAGSSIDATGRRPTTRGASPIWGPPSASGLGSAGGRQQPPSGPATSSAGPARAVPPAPRQAPPPEPQERQGVGSGTFPPAAPEATPGRAGRGGTAPNIPGGTPAGPAVPAAPAGPGPAPVTRDARPGGTDAYAGRTDPRDSPAATFGTPPATPDARPATPTAPAAGPATPATPDAKPATPSATPTKPAMPDAGTAAPGVRPATSDASSATSDARPATPDAGTAAPGVRPATSDASFATSDARPATPDAGTAAPGVRPATSDASSATSDARSAVPGAGSGTSGTAPDAAARGGHDVAPAEAPAVPAWAPAATATPPAPVSADPMTASSARAESIGRQRTDPPAPARAEDAVFGELIPPELPDQPVRAAPSTDPSASDSGMWTPLATATAATTGRPRSPGLGAPGVPGRSGPITLPAPDISGASLLPASSANPFAALVTDLVCRTGPASVRLIGARPARWGSAYGWLADGEQPPPSSAPVILGEHDGRRLWIDLAVAPDALTIGGDQETARRQALSLVTQLDADTDVLVIGDVLGATIPGRCRRIESVDGLVADRSEAKVRVLVCAGQDAPGLSAPLRAMPQGRQRTVPMVIGSAPAARWSVRLGAATVPAAQ
ncbi:hypothetical protein ACIA8K_03595 [Catenuloplanes sp. NPDC051500]|uniref:hypothetical protein n=1 Tax=Catenuloplanes sp. NPDC051500 TaxID=3363959 RepID=UPI003788708B